MLAASEMMATSFLPSMKDFLCYSEDGWITDVQACLAVMAVENIHSVHACHTVCSSYYTLSVAYYVYCTRRHKEMREALGPAQTRRNA